MSPLCAGALRRGESWDPGGAPLVATRAWLQSRWRDLAAKEVARRRKGYEGAALGLDWGTARGRLEDRWLSAGRRAALLTVMVGDVVTAARASHLCDRAWACPHCSTGADECVRHLLWACPR